LTFPPQTGLDRKNAIFRWPLFRAALAQSNRGLYEFYARIFKKITANRPKYPPDRMSSSEFEHVAREFAMNRGEATAPLPLERAAAVVRRSFMLLLLGVYGLAAVAPGWGIATRDISLSPVYFGVPVPFAAALLAVLLYSAGLGVSVTDFPRAGRFSTTLIAGLVGSWLLGPAVVVLLSFLLPSGGAAAACLAGLALVAIMPPANSSAAWTQNAGGDLRLNLGLIVFATLLCPLAAPAAAAVLAAGPGIESSHWIQGAWGMMLLMLWIAIPIGLGIATRAWLRPGVVERAAPVLSLSNSLILLLLNYCQASLALPRLLDGRTPGVAQYAALAALAFTGLLFAGAWLVARRSGADRPQRLALLFGLGMKNTGAALALAGPVLAAHPAALLTIILCTLSQHLLAGFCDLMAARPLTSSPAPEPCE
jgi:bile acid:Na+ symporter, BASS family